MDWMDVLSKFLETLLLGLISLFVPVLAAWVLAKAKHLLADLKSKADVFLVLEQVARIAVKAAEQANVAGLVQDKKQYALKIATTYLEQHGLKINLSTIDAALEAAVYDEFNRYKLPIPTNEA